MRFSRRDRAAVVRDWTEVDDVPFEDGPDLPSRHRYDRPWPGATRVWWSVISRMPHCVLWSEADWRFALDTAQVAAAFHAGDLSQAKELRQREKILGTTADARRELRIRYVLGPAEDERHGIAAIEGYRMRLSQR